ncbi:hypothetical protein AWRIB429_1462 [Oenococcus oeni AWRIB429]|uniref:Uncharacterized protein n=1 Tax=Oenococcus oeni AWRIB429 TaxID=655225 RepID=D3LAT2_OENOE|nr:hypothetical protein AWRIB429_1462 [Oenococcus oeni AWRIB429]KZD14570.1 hypothetical protein AC229_1407 [Oenococcus oeni]
MFTRLNRDHKNQVKSYQTISKKILSQMSYDDHHNRNDQ